MDNPSNLHSVNNLELTLYLKTILNVDSFKDYCPNSLQIEGNCNITTLVSGVTINQELIEHAINHKAQGILVHHGIFWKGDNPCITGIKKERIQALLKHNLNLWAYHLPLDAHAKYGNNACIGNLLGLQTHQYFGDQNLGCISNIENNPIHNNYKSSQQLHKKLEQIFDRNVLVFGNLNREIKKIAWCSGGAQSYFNDAIIAGCDVFISGEISEQYVHTAKENSVLYMVAGHHATERYGVQALGNHLAEKYNIKHIFVDVDSKF
ncbi:MAG: cyclohydrolase 1 type 2 [Pseudomonadota bacterium]|jgi:dinuclear metal center YbgI/SA1388 family protein